MIFANLEQLPPDPILGVTAAFRADPSPDKIDLGVGVYRDEKGETPVPAAVREAERAMLAAQRTKTYVGPAGNLEFNRLIVEMALGPVAAGLRERTATIQTVGGCGALRLGAELINASQPGSVMHVSDPTWANHEPLLGSSGLKLARYPYYDPTARGVSFEAMRDHVAGLPTGSIVLLHGCCHNPTGADLSHGEWQALGDVIESRGLVRLYLEAEAGITVEDCARVSRAVSEVLDAEDPIPGEYTLEVSSPGLERPLRTAGHFGRFVGETVFVELAQPQDGRRRFLGLLAAADATTIEVEVDGQRHVLPMSGIRKAHLAPQA
jgi:aspartate/tyrosine/aromatic aminotransferase